MFYVFELNKSYVPYEKKTIIILHVVVVIWIYSITIISVA